MKFKFANCKHDVPWNECDQCEHSYKIDNNAPEVGLHINGILVSEKK